MDDRDIIDSGWSRLHVDTSVETVDSRWLRSKTHLDDLESRLWMIEILDSGWSRQNRLWSTQWKPLDDQDWIPWMIKTSQTLDNRDWTLLDDRDITTTTTTFVCSLNPIRQTSIPRPYTIISLLSFHHCSSQPSQYPSVSSRAYTRLLNETL